MFNDTKLLVVDDEEVICRGCRRILSPSGFRVDTSTDSREGLSLALEQDYAAVLLDMRMPGMDGLRFLTELRKVKPDVPVIVITGYPSETNESSVMRLGGVQYLVKPFTPELIVRAVQESLSARQVKTEVKPSAAGLGTFPWIPATRDILFWDESWLEMLRGGTVRVGAMLPRAQGGTVESVWPPGVNWNVCQGLPLASATITGQMHVVVPSPVTGVVVACNELLFEHPSLLWDDPCGDGWIACIAPTRLEMDTRRCRPRRLVLANANESSARHQRAQLAALGCQVRLAGGVGDIGPALQKDPPCTVLVMDAPSLGEEGPELVRRVNTANPEVKVVAIGCADCKWESAYRRNRILYYAVEPFVDDEIVDIVDAAFRPPITPQRRVERHAAEVKSITGIRVTVRDGETVALVAECGLLRQDDGLGRQILQELNTRGCSVEIVSEQSQCVSSAIQRAEATCDRVVTLLARDGGRLPGSLTREEFRPVPGAMAKQMTVLLVQHAPGDDPVAFDPRTTAALAEHIVREMVSR